MSQLVEGKDYLISTDGVLLICEGIKYIPSFSFSENTKITSVIFPSTLIDIGAHAFNGCILLNEKVTIPDSVEYIRDCAFHNCSIDELVIGRNVKYIGYKAFWNNNISEVTNNSEKLKFIGDKAFFNNYDGMKFDVNGELVYLGDDVWTNQLIEYSLINSYKAIKLESAKCCSWFTSDSYDYKDGVLKIKDGVEVIGNFRSLNECKAIEMPDSVLFILPLAFYDSSNLEYIKFSNNLLYIGGSAFSGCNLRKNGLDLSDSLCSISPSSFLNNGGCKAITIPITLFCIDAGAVYEVRKREPNYLNQVGMININDLLEVERKQLESLNLLPNKIIDHKNNIREDQNSLITIIKDALIKYLMDDNYDEINEYSFIENVLNSKGIDISDIHDVVNYLFTKNQIKTIYLLISYGYNYFNNSMLSRAIINNMYDMIDILLLIGVDINEIGTIDMTPLSIACKKGDLSLVKHLIEKGAAINKVDSYNKVAIDYANENNHKDIVEYINSFNKEETGVQRDLDVVAMILNTKPIDCAKDNIHEDNVEDAIFMAEKKMKYKMM